MIISHKHKFIFFRPRKAASSTFQCVLANFLGDDDITTGLPQHTNELPDRLTECRNYESIAGILPSMTEENFTRYSHMSPYDIRQLVSEEQWNEYTKVSIVRNPWDRVYSLYCFRNFVFERDYGITNFTEFVRSELWHTELKWTLTPLTEWATVDGVYSCDHVLKFETFNDDLLKFLEDLEIEKDGVDIPNLKGGYRPKHDSYVKAYTPETVRTIGNYFMDDIVTFGYSFGG
jgi:hypothetical protein